MATGGGAQLTDRAHFLEGRLRGHDIDLWLPSSGTVDFQVDGAIISNATSFGFDFLRDLTTTKPCVWFLHDYWPACRYRLYYPMLEDRCRALPCYLKERWLPVLQKAKLIVWLSPLHRESWLWLYPELESVPYHLAPSPVNPDKFYDMKLPRKGVVAVESLAEFKGKRHVLQWAEEHPDVEITFVGGTPEADSLPSNCRDAGLVPYHLMNEVYNQHEALLHLPQSPSPFDRTTAEAYLAGCRIIGNELIGALSWPFFREGRDAVAKACRESPQGFWEAIERAVS